MILTYHNWDCFLSNDYFVWTMHINSTVKTLDGKIMSIMGITTLAMVYFKW